MQREIKKYLFDIKIAINSINDYLGNNRDFNNYKSNKLLRRGIVDLRNWVIHAYDNVDDTIIWGIIINNIPKLKVQIQALLKNDRNS